ncbi:hypothetical protein [Aestuariivivens sediminicola]|uniref:hypothetical protein n=1 Tax=Aestuariivivens sediminicola TaxID=2913560 RepID=UPI001F585457|nr:hypothetical protein [Aestuariivivens sediminicola]
MKHLLAYFLSCLILLQSCNTYRRPKWTLNKAVNKHETSTVFFKDSIKTYDYVINTNDGYFGVIKTRVKHGFMGYNYEHKYDKLIKNQINSIRGPAKKDQTWSIIGGVALVGFLIWYLIEFPEEAVEDLFFPEDDY